MWLLLVGVLLTSPHGNILGTINIQASFPSYAACMRNAERMPAIYRSFRHSLVEVSCHKDPLSK